MATLTEKFNYRSKALELVFDTKETGQLRVRNPDDPQVNFKALETSETMLQSLSGITLDRRAALTGGIALTLAVAAAAVHEGPELAEVFNPPENSLPIEPFDHTSLANQLALAKETNKPVEAPGLIEPNGRNLMFDVEHLLNYAEKVDAEKVEWTISYTTGEAPQTIGFDKNALENFLSLKGTIIEENTGRQRIRVPLRPTDEPFRITYYEKSPTREVTSDTEDFPHFFPSYDLPDGQEERLVYVDGDERGTDSSSLHTYYANTFQFLAPHRELPRLNIPQPDEKFGKVLQRDLPEEPVNEWTIQLTSKIFEYENPQRVYELAYKLGWFFYQEATRYPTTTLGKTAAELRTRMETPLLTEKLTTPIDLSYDWETQPETTVFDHILNPDSYDDGLNGIVAAEVTPEHATAGFFLQVWKAYLNLPHNPRYSDIILHLDALKYVNFLSNDERIRLDHVYGEMSRVTPSQDPRISDKAVAACVTQPIGKLLSLQTSLASDEYKDCVEEIVREMGISDRSPYATFPPINPYYNSEANLSEVQLGAVNPQGVHTNTPYKES